ncbi:MAG: hypothetical protein FWH56_07590 [Betaproteobacteria bacterium]|nr:hypothetical protein [Betaproteobacteria bacterium]
MNRPGPVLEILLRRLADTPPDFLAEPRIGRRGEVFVPALVNDLFVRLGHRISHDALKSFHEQESAARNRLSVAMILVWLLSDEWFAQACPEREAVLRLLMDTAGELAQSAAAQKYVNDPERREELARLTLARLDFRPAGETEAQATDRLSALSATERRRLVQASREAQARARAIREALLRKQAEESADKWTRE